MDGRNVAREKSRTHNPPWKGTTCEKENLSGYRLFSGGEYADG
jgi:hypothetical protein